MYESKCNLTEYFSALHLTVAVCQKKDDSARSQFKKKIFIYVASVTDKAL